MLSKVGLCVFATTMDRIKGWFVRSPQQQHTAPAVDLNLADAASSSSSDATDAVMQATAAAVEAAAAASADLQASSSSSTGNDGSDAAEPSTSQQEEPASINPMMQTALTKRFQGRFEPLQMPTYESMMQEDFMNNCAVRSVIAGGMGGMLGVAFGIFTASLDTQVGQQHSRCGHRFVFVRGRLVGWQRKKCDKQW